MIQKDENHDNPQDLIDYLDLQEKNQACAFYKNVNEFKEFILSLVIKSLELNTRVIFITNAALRDDLLLEITSRLNNQHNLYFQNNLLNFIILNDNDSPSNLYLKLQDECQKTVQLQHSSILLISDMESIGIDILNADSVIEYESALSQLTSAFKYISLSLYKERQANIVQLNKIIELYPQCYIEKEMYSNCLYSPFNAIADDESASLSFNHRLKTLKMYATHQKANLMGKNDIKKYLYKLAHDLKSPIRAVNIMNNILQEEFTELSTEQRNDLLKKMSASLIQAYKQIDSLEAYTKDIDSGL